MRRKKDQTLEVQTLARELVRDHVGPDELTLKRAIEIAEIDVAQPKIDRGAELEFLPSVGTMLNILTLQTFPTNADGTPDDSCPTHLEDCCEEWWAALDRADIGKIELAKREATR